jgi:hypothetical protein
VQSGLLLSNGVGGATMSGARRGTLLPEEKSSSYLLTGTVRGGKIVARKTSGTLSATKTNGAIVRSQ